MSRLMIVEVPSYSAEFKGIREVGELIRCKECKHAHMTYGGDCKHCDMWKDDDDFSLELYLDGDFYCAYGEREGE